MTVLSKLEQDLLLFVAAHELVLMEQAATVLEISHEDALEQLATLRSRGLVSRVRLSSSSPPVYRVTPDGADLIDSALPPLRPLDPLRYRHEVAVPWLWCAGRHGTLGELREILSRREMQAADATLRTESLLDTAGATFADDPPGDGEVDLDVVYPDLGMVQATGGWASLDLFLFVPEPQWLRDLLARYRRDKQMRAQLFMVEQDGQTRELIERTAAEMGLVDRVFVQWLAEDGIAGG